MYVLRRGTTDSYSATSDRGSHTEYAIFTMSFPMVDIEFRGGTRRFRVFSPFQSKVPEEYNEVCIVYVFFSGCWFGKVGQSFGSTSLSLAISLSLGASKSPCIQHCVCMLICIEPMPNAFDLCVKSVRQSSESPYTHGSA